MKKKIISLLVFAIITTQLSSCYFHEGYGYNRHYGNRRIHDEGRRNDEKRHQEAGSRQDTRNTHQENGHEDR